MGRKNGNELWEKRKKILRVLSETKSKEERLRIRRERVSDMPQESRILDEMLKNLNEYVEVLETFLADDNPNIEEYSKKIRPIIAEYETKGQLFVEVDNLHRRRDEE